MYRMLKLCFWLGEKLLADEQHTEAQTEEVVRWKLCPSCQSDSECWNFFQQHFDNLSCVITTLRTHFLKARLSSTNSHKQLVQ